MTDKIGLFELYTVREMSRTANMFTLESYFRTEVEFRQFEEFCRKATGNVTVHNLLGGQQIGVDITDGSVLTQYCEFDSDKLKDGWYMIVAMDSRAEHKHNFWPFTIKLLFLGTRQLYQDGYSVYMLGEVDNDWGI